MVGFTDSVGGVQYNVDLSWYREESVRRFLVEKGAELNRIAFIGLGEDLAGDDSKNPTARAKNRSAAIRIYRPAD